MTHDGGLTCVWVGPPALVDITHPSVPCEVVGVLGNLSSQILDFVRKVCVGQHKTRTLYGSSTIAGGRERFMVQTVIA